MYVSIIKILPILFSDPLGIHFLVTNKMLTNCFKDCLKQLKMTMKLTRFITSQGAYVTLILKTKMVLSPE